ncbi:hypothetical protein [Mesorhizobium sp. M0816]|uniref:hypothetical protein n=1 Tax=Mesorhizobium sp. M0816 TaxID=2957006 RepID=UPI003337DADC
MKTLPGRKVIASVLALAGYCAVELFAAAGGLNPAVGEEVSITSRSVCAVAGKSTLVHPKLLSGRADFDWSEVMVFEFEEPDIVWVGTATGNSFHQARFQRLEGGFSIDWPIKSDRYGAKIKIDDKGHLVGDLNYKFPDNSSRESHYTGQCKAEHRWPVTVTHKEMAQCGSVCDGLGKRAGLYCSANATLSRGAETTVMPSEFALHFQPGRIVVIAERLKIQPLMVSRSEGNVVFMTWARNSTRHKLSIRLDTKSLEIEGSYSYNLGDGTQRSGAYKGKCSETDMESALPKVMTAEELTRSLAF